MSDSLWRNARIGAAAIPLQSLWAGFIESDWAARTHSLRVFLEAFASRCSQSPPSSVPHQFRGVRELSRELLWWLVNSVMGAHIAGGDAGVLQYLASREGALVLWSLDVALSRDTRLRGCAEAAIALSRVAESILMLPAHVTAAALSAPQQQAHQSQQRGATGTASALPPGLMAQFCDVSASISTPVLAGLRGTAVAKHLPQVFGFLSGPPAAAPAQARAEQQVPVTFLGCICTRLLSVVAKLFLDVAGVRHVLSREGSVDPLLRILAIDYSRASDMGMYTVHRQLVRTLGSLLWTASQEVGAIVILAQRGVVEAFVAVLKANLLAGSIRMELVSMLVHILRSTSRLCCGLVDAFRQCGGYDVFLNAFLSVERHGTPAERYQFIQALCNLLFVVPSPAVAINAMSAAEKTAASASPAASPPPLPPPSPSSPVFSREDAEDLLCLQNQDGIKLLLSAFVQVTNEELKTELLKAVQAIFIVQVHKTIPADQHIGRMSANPFTALFVQFDDLSDVNKTRILAMLDDVVVLGNLSLVELRAYCALLQGKRPSTIVMICRHMIGSLQRGTMTRIQLHEAGLLSILSTYLVPPSELPCAGALVDPEEFRVTESLLAAERDSPAEIDAGPLVSPRPPESAAKFAANPAAYALLCHISRSVLRLLCAFLTNNDKSQSVLKDSPNFKSLYGLLYTPEVRIDALKVITIVAHSFHKLEHRIIQSLIAVLQSSGGTTVEDPDVIMMWTSVLESLHAILDKNKEAAFSFRAGGGFAWALSVIEGFTRSKSADPPASDSKGLAQSFLLMVLRVLRAALKGCPENFVYLKNDIGFNTFSLALKSCMVFCISSAEVLTDSLLSMAVHGAWPPPPCKHSPAPAASAGQSPPSAPPAAMCADCSEALTIEVPDMISIVVTELLDTVISSSPSDSPTPLAILDSVARIAGASVANVEVLCTYDLGNKILEHYKQVLFDQYRRGDRVAERLIGLIVLLCSHHVTTAQMRQLLEAVSCAGHPPELLAVLQRMMRRPRAPACSVEISRRSGAIGLSSKWLAERQWPSRKFSVSMWLRVDSYGKPASQPLSQTLFLFKSNNRGAQVCASVCQGTLTFQLSPPPAAQKQDSPRLPGSVVFSEVKFEEGLWYHVAISADSSAPDKLQRKAAAPANRFLVLLYVNGMLRAQASLFLVPPTSTHVALHVGFDPGSAMQEPDKASGFRLSTAYFFEEAMSQHEAFLMYVLGPSYSGNLAVDFSHYRHSLDPSACSPSESVQKLLLQPASCTLRPLMDRLLAIFVARRAAVVEAEPAPEQTVTVVAPSGEAQPINLSGSGTPDFVRFSRDIRETLNDVGGMPVVLYMLGVAQTKDHQQSAFRLLISLMRGSARNCQQMEACSGYKVVARLMKKPAWALDEDMLDLAFALVGVSKSPGSTAFDAGVVADTNALRQIVLDWQIWTRAPAAVQQQLLSGLFSLVSINNASAFNVKRLSQCGAVEELLHILQRPATSPFLIPMLINLVKSIMDDTMVARSDMQAIADFLFATHKPPISFKYTIPGARRPTMHQHRRSLSEEGRQSVLRMSSPAEQTSHAPGGVTPRVDVIRKDDAAGVPGSSLTMIATEGVDPSQSVPPEDAEPEPEFIPADLLQQQPEASDEMTHKRSYVLEMLLDILSKAGASTQAEFAEVFPVEAILSMMQHPSLSLRIPLLLLLDLCLQQSPSSASVAASPSSSSSSGISASPTPAAVTPAPAGSSISPVPPVSTAYQKFLRIGGFALLGTQLQSYSASGELFHALFRLLIGTSFPRASKTELHLTVHSAWEQAAAKGQTELARPEVIKSIMMVAAGPLAELPEQHSVIKSLHHLYASSAPAAQGLLDNGLISGLFDVLSSRIEQRRAKRKTARAAAAAATAPTPSTGTPPPQVDLAASAPPAALPLPQGEDEGTDEDILSLLTAIALHPCKKSSCYKNLSEMLLLARSTGFPHGIPETLQSRILHDVFAFFTDNPRFIRDGALVANLDMLITVAIEFFRWKILPDAGHRHHQDHVSPRSGPGSGRTITKLLYITRVPADRTVVMLMKLLVTVLGSANESGAKENMSRFYEAYVDNIWRLLLHVLRGSKSSPDLLDAALDAVSSKAVMSDPLEHRCCSLLIAVSDLLTAEPASLREKAKRVFEVLRKQTRRPSLLSVVTSTLSTPLLWRMSTPAPVVDTAAKLEQRYGKPPSPELRCLSGSIVDEAFRWEDQEHFLASEFQLAMDRLLVAQLKQLGALRKTVREQRVNITQAVTSLQWRAQTKPTVERSERTLDDANEAAAAWKMFFRRLTHKRAVFAIAVHSPYRRLKLDNTQDSQRQRLRLRWVIAGPTSPTLNPPYMSPRMTGPHNPGILLPVEPTTQQFCHRLVDGSRPPTTDRPVDELPLITDLVPLREEGTRGGTEITVIGKFFRRGDPGLRFFFGGITADIVRVVSDTTVVVRSPPQPRPGIVEVNAVLDGQVRRGAAARYGYLELSKYEAYLTAKNALKIRRDDTPAILEPRIMRSASPPHASPPPATQEEEPAHVRERSGSFSTAGSFLLHRGEQIKFTAKCTWISAFTEREGDLLLIDKGIFFFQSQPSSSPSSASPPPSPSPSQQQQQAGTTYSWSYDDVCEIHRRRYILKDVALELFFATGKTCLLTFPETAVRDRVWREIKTMPLPNLHDYDTEDDLRSGLLMSSSLTDKWVRGQISNFEYLMRLNIVAGRTFNDLNQYPVFPFLIADYTSVELDLTNPATFRDLSKPMGAQDKARIQRFLDKYTQLQEMGEVPYHYGTHYSNGAVVTHFLSRLEPFAAYHVVFQGGKFDIPDRLFFDIGATWALASGSPLGDVKELTPEFFSLPEFLDNPNLFDFGERQDGSRVFAVHLPAWAHGSPREFIRLHREALESDFVSAHLHEWIDLIFGFRQQDRDSLNVFHPYTCEGGIDWDSIKDSMDRLAKQTQVNTWGQTPRQIFRRAHPRRSIRAVQMVASGPAFGVGGFPVESQLLFTMSTLAPVGAVYPTPENTATAVDPGKAQLSKSEYLSWNHWDNTVRVCSIDTKKATTFAETVDAGDSLTTAVLSPSGHCFVCGTSTGVVFVWKRRDPQKSILASPSSSLFGHRGAIRSAYASGEYSIIATGSDDGTCIVWDSNRMTYEHRLKHAAPVLAICVSPVNGNIFTVTVDQARQTQSDLHMWSINGDHICVVSCEQRVLCVQTTSNALGVRPNVVATGNEDGTISLWSAITLAKVGLLSGHHSSSITALSFSKDNLHLFSGDARGQVVKWTIRSEDQETR